MKRVWVVLCILLLVPLVAASPLYQKESMDLQLTVEGEYELVGGGSVKEVTTNLLLVPQENYRQTVVKLESDGVLGEESVLFEWEQPAKGTQTYSYTADVETKNQRVKVTKKVPFPIAEVDVQEFQQYLQPTVTIDSDNPLIIAKAAELAEGQDDLFKIVFSLAEWVDRTVEYDLNTLTATASQKASWVLQHEEGVCDEMTSLFIAMSRSLGIPARFVSGISYTDSELFAENWQPHGWAEVYFPEIGWVSFDITFGEYGYVDVTHIKLRDGFDPTEPATKFKWYATGVDLEAKELTLDVTITGEGPEIPEEIVLEQEVLAKKVTFGSYNVIKGVLKNNADYYAASTLNLAVPEEVEILGRNRRTILMGPKEVKETFWTVKISDDLNGGYWYQLPVIVYSEKNISVEDVIVAQEGKPFYTEKEVLAIAEQDEEKSYSRKVAFNCGVLEEMKLGEEHKVTCSVKNNGNTNLMNVEFCLNGICDTVDLLINQQAESIITLQNEEVGWQKLFVSAENDVIQKKDTVDYVVLDEPRVSVAVEAPGSVLFGEPLDMVVLLEKVSFASAENIEVVLEGRGFENTWTVANLQSTEELELHLEDYPLRSNNAFTVEVTWKDNRGKVYSEVQGFSVQGEGQSFVEKVKLFVNSIIPMFS